MKPASDRSGGLLRRTLHRLSADPRELDAQLLQSQSESAGATPVVGCSDGERVRIAGTINAVTLQPRGEAPALEAVLYDGTGQVTLIWLGRRRIAGIEPGRSMVVAGRIGRMAGRAVIYNPDYELRPAGWNGG
jgi:RecG-like helicase